MRRFIDRMNRIASASQADTNSVLNAAGIDSELSRQRYDASPEELLAAASVDIASSRQREQASREELLAAAQDALDAGVPAEIVEEQLRQVERYRSQ